MNIKLQWRSLSFLVLLAFAGCGGDTNAPADLAIGESDAVAPVAVVEPVYRQVLFYNNTGQPVRQIVATDGDKTYRIGSVTVQELLHDIIKSDPIRDIYDYVSPAVEHFCSNGTYIPDEFKKATILNRLYSYSFGCCSDVNEPMLASLYVAAGYEGHVLSSALHVAIEVCDPTGNCHYADVDQDLFYDGGLDVARSLNGGIAYWFSDDKIHKQKNGELRPLAAEAEAIPPTEFTFSPADYIAFTTDPVQTPVMRIYDDLQISPVDSTRVGVAKISLSPYEVGEVEGCMQYRMRFPYVLLSARLSDESDTSAELDARGRYNLEFEVCEASGAIVAPEKRVLWLRFQYNSNIFPDMARLTATGAATLKYQ